MLPPSLKHLLNPEEQHDGLAHPSQDAQGSAEALHPQHLTFAEKYGRLSSCDQTMWAFIEEAAARAHPLAEQKREYEHLHRRFNDLESYRLRCSQHFSVLAKRHNAFHRRMQEQDNKYQTTTATRTAALQKHVEISHQLQEFDFQLALSRIHGAMHEAQQDSVSPPLFHRNNPYIPDRSRRLALPLISNVKSFSTCSKLKHVRSANSMRRSNKSCGRCASCLHTMFKSTMLLTTKRTSATPYSTSLRLCRKKPERCGMNLFTRRDSVSCPSHRACLSCCL